MPVLNSRRRVGILLSACSSIVLLLASTPIAAQSHSGTLKGKIIDGITHKTIYNASVAADSSSKKDTTTADGRYSLTLGEGMHTIYCKHEGFQDKVIARVHVYADDIDYLDIVLYPVASNNKGSIHVDLVTDRLGSKTIQPGTDQDGAQVLRRLNGVIVENKAGSSGLSTLNIAGFGDRYNKVLFNGASFPSYTPTGRAWPLNLIPVEAIEEVTLQRTGNPSVSGDFAGGVADIRTKDMPDQNFFYIRAGGGFSDATSGKDFYRDKSKNPLPPSFPTTRSQYSLDQLNPQEQVFQSKLLKNDLAPVKHGPTPNDRVVLGFGKIIKLKKGEKIGVLAMVTHQNTYRIDEATVQAAPDMITNLYPFADGSKPLIRSLSDDITYRYSSQLGAILNASILFGKNKVSLKNFFSQGFTGAYTRRSNLFKPDEDSLAHTGINYLPTQTTLLNTQLSGEHALGGDGKFKLTWLASYAYVHRQNADERNFLLRQDSSGNSLFELARPQSPAYSSSTTDQGVMDANFTNSARQWRDNKEHNFTGTVDIHTPFDLGGYTQVLSGGVSVQTKYRVVNTDLYLTNGPGYFSLDQLLAPERYFPGGVSMQNWYANNPQNLNFIYANNRANYQASDNLGAAYIALANSFPKNLSLNWGFRLESSSQLVSAIRYVYSSGFKYPQVSTLDENTKITRTVLLPSVTAAWQPFAPFRIQASYFKTVNRPGIQELSAYRNYDPLSFTVTTGNPVLNSTDIDTYDAGVSWQPAAGTRVAVSGFYKKLDQPIGYVITAYSTGNLASAPYNLPSANIKGLTADIKIDLGYDLSAIASGTWSKSKVSAGPIRYVGKAVEHTLNGSPGYIVNAGLVMQHPRLPMITVLYSRIGDYIIASGSGAQYKLTSGSSVLAIPDYRMKERDNLDIQFAQKFWHSRIQLIAGVNNLTNAASIEYQDLNGNKKFDKPLSLALLNNSGGYFRGGTDNTVLSTKPQRTYYLTFSYLFK